MTKKIIWRLSESPRVSDLVQLVQMSVITADEAREMVIREENDCTCAMKHSGECESAEIL